MQNHPADKLKSLNFLLRKKDLAVWISNRKRSPCLQSLTYINTRGVGRIRDSHVREFSLLICTTVQNFVENSLILPTPLAFISGYARKYRKNVFYCFYELTFPIKNAKLFVMALVK